MSEMKLAEGFEERVQAAGGEILPPSADSIPSVRVKASSLIELLVSFKNGPGARFEMLTDVCGVDEYPKEPRFDVIYHLRCLRTGELARVKVFAEGDNHEVPSAVPIYPTANWHEREAFDMMGIVFTGHPDLKRILMPLEFEYHPLRKDFPLDGIEPDRLYKQRFPEKSLGSMHQKTAIEQESAAEREGPNRVGQDKE